MEPFSRETKQKIVDACRFMQAERMVLGTWGNISVRTEAGVIITPSRVNYDTMTPDDLVTVDLNGRVIEGNRVPSSETDLHTAIYRRREDIGCVVHNHSLYASVFAAAEMDIPPIVEEQSQIIGGTVRCTPEYIPAGHHIDLANLAAQTLEDKNAVLISHHGAVCCGKDMDEALTVARVLEKTAQLYLFMKQMGVGERIIPDSLVHEERFRFLYKYGKA
ncbi:MAG: class II aldolase/adducin family protein [Firmicutes bacterium]|jgi:L-fuculose-phosphate aldolase|nr:class II aldolase/adducin family protein [Bacillota bacterium]